MSEVNAFEILLVEDDPRDIELTVRVLRKRNLANKLHVVEDGADALDFIHCRNKYEQMNITSSPKVVFLDLKLPKVSGLEVLRQLKADEKTRSIPVVIVTSSREDPDIKQAYALGANSYVVKPADYDEFQKAVTQLGLYWLLVNQAPALTIVKG
ncbi:MAG: response regulator [Thermodesulfobacteriota bacterium]|jgi:two-component system response regulator